MRPIARRSSMRARESSGFAQKQMRVPLDGERRKIAIKMNMKKVFLILSGSLLLVLVLLIIIRLLGYNFNKEFVKDFIDYNRKQCIIDEYPTYSNHSGIAGCIFWMREGYLQKTQSWRDQFKEDDVYCSQKYHNKNSSSLSNLQNALAEYGDPKCEYEAFRAQKRNENWDYLVSKEQDEFYEYCVNKICPRPSIFQ